MELTLPNLVNVSIHVVAGTIAILIGFVIMWRSKGDERHKRWGRYFLLFGFIVCVTAAFGLTVFRFLPLFAVLTVLVLYQLVSGWRVIKTKEQGPGLFDGLWTFFGVLCAVSFFPLLAGEIDIGQTSVIYSALGGLSIVLIYDSSRWLFPRGWHAVLWKYEHIYKLNAALFGMISAFVGNVIRFGQPWSQVLPSALGFVVIFFFFVRTYQDERGETRLVSSEQ